MGYSYYDTPDGEDCFKKLWYTTRYAAGAGVVISTFDVLLYTKPQGYYQTVARYAYHTLPFVGMAAAFTSTVCVATSFRKKDDELNYLLGAIAAGSVAGKWLKSGYKGFQFSLLFGIAALVKKNTMLNGILLFPEPGPKERGNLMTVRQDYTIMKERPRNWVVSRE